MSTSNRLLAGIFAATLHLPMGSLILGHPLSIPLNQMLADNPHRRTKLASRGTMGHGRFQHFTS